jgi:hypothetical protein
MSATVTQVFNKIFISIDIFGVKPRLTVKQTYKYNSVTGGVFSFLFYICTLLGLVYFGMMLFIKTNPNILQTSLFDQSPYRYNLSLDNFGFFVGVENAANYSYYYDPSTYNVNFVLAVTDRYWDDAGKSFKFKNTNTKLRGERCLLDRHFPNYKEAFTDQDLSLYTCLHPDDAAIAFMEGTWGEKIYSTLKVDISACKNGTVDGIVCRDPETIDRLLSGAFFGIDFLDTIFDPSNYEKPNKSIRKDLFTVISNKYFKTWNFFFNNIDYKTDAGWLLEDIDTKPYLQFERFYELIDFRVDPVFFRLAMRMSQIRLSYTRSYYKLQTFIAQLGGLIKGIMILIKIILYTFTHNDFYSHMINESYICPDKPIRPRTMSVMEDRTDSRLRSSKLTGQVAVNNLVTPGTASNGLIFDQNKFKKFTRKEVKLSWCQSLKLMMPCRVSLKNAELRNYYVAAKRIKRNLDIVNINKSFEELGSIKDIVFSKNGSVLLKFLNDNIILEDLVKHKDIGLGQLQETYNSLGQSQCKDSLKALFEEKYDKLNNFHT